MIVPAEPARQQNPAALARLKAREEAQQTQKQQMLEEIKN